MSSSAASPLLWPPIRWKKRPARLTVRPRERASSMRMPSSMGVRLAAKGSSWWAAAARLDWDALLDGREAGREGLVVVAHLRAGGRHLVEAGQRGDLVRGHVGEPAGVEPGGGPAGLDQAHEARGG